MGGNFQYWTPGTLIYRGAYREFLVATASGTPSAIPIGIRSETISPFFRWLGNTIDATITELLGSGYIWTYIDHAGSSAVPEISERQRFISLKTEAHTYVIQALVTARSATDVKTWRVTLTVGYISSTFQILSQIKEILHASSGASAWDITLSAAELNTDFNYLKFEALGAADTSISWNANAIYSEV